MVKNLSLFDRYKIIFYWQGLNGPKNSYSEIASHLNCNIKTVIKWIKCFKKTGDVLDQPHPGRPFKTTPHQDQLIVSMAKSPNQPSTRKISQQLKERGINISRKVVLSRLHESGLKYTYPLKKPLLSVQHCKYRLSWALKHQHFDWSNCIFTDEVTFYLFDNKVKSWNDPRFPKVQRIVKHPQKIHAWGCFSKNSFGKLFTFKENLDADLMVKIYKKALLHSIPACFEHRNKDWILQEDNDPKHRSAKCKQWKADNQINVLPWPSCSPDLNPIENVWAFMKHKNAEKNPPTIRSLELEIHKVWKSLQSDYGGKLILSMENRITSCILAKGDYICY
jgi:transposase